MLWRTKRKRTLTQCCWKIEICRKYRSLQIPLLSKNTAGYDAVMRTVPFGRVTTVGEIRSFFARKNNADFTDPITAGIFVSIAAWASYQRKDDQTPYWRTLKADGELNPKYPGGVEEQKKRLEDEGHTIVTKGRTRLRYVVKDYEAALYRPM